MRFIEHFSPVQAGRAFFPAGVPLNVRERVQVLVRVETRITGMLVELIHPRLYFVVHLASHFSFAAE